MNKVLRLVLTIFATIIAFILILGLIEPTSPTVTRSIAIKAPKPVVFEQVSVFRNWPNWSPWKQKDPSMRMVFSGEDGQVGSGYNWFGDEKITGQGSMKMTAVKNGEVDYDVAIFKPRMAMNSVMTVNDSADGYTKVTWSTTHHKAYPLNAIYLLMNMDKRMGSDFEKGLELLKSYVEGHMNDYVEIQEVNFPGHTYAGVRNMVFWDEMMKFFGDNYGMLGKTLGPKINGVPVGLYFLWDTVNKRADMMAAFPVSDTTTHLKGATYVTVEPSSAYMAVQKGGYSTSNKIHKALEAYLDKKGKNKKLIVEEYKVGPGSEPDSNKWVTNVYYLLK